MTHKPAIQRDNAECFSLATSSPLSVVMHAVLVSLPINPQITPVIDQFACITSTLNATLSTLAAIDRKKKGKSRAFHLDLFSAPGIPPGWCARTCNFLGAYRKSIIEFEMHSSLSSAGVITVIEVYSDKAWASLRTNVPLISLFVRG